MASNPTENKDTLFLATLAQKTIQANAERVEASFAAAVRVDGEEYPAITIANRKPKPEGMPCEGGVKTIDELPGLVADFTKACLRLKKNNTVLVWRRLPAIEKDGGTYKITARLSWVPNKGIVEDALHGH